MNWQYTYYLTDVLSILCFQLTEDLYLCVPWCKYCLNFPYWPIRLKVHNKGLCLPWSLRENCPSSEFFWSVFSRIRTEYGEILRISPYSVRMQENTDQKNSEYGHFSRSGSLIRNCVLRLLSSLFISFIWKENYWYLTHTSLSNNSIFWLIQKNK